MCSDHHALFVSRMNPMPGGVWHVHTASYKAGLNHSQGTPTCIRRSGVDMFVMLNDPKGSVLSM